MHPEIEEASNVDHSNLPVDGSKPCKKIELSQSRHLALFWLCVCFILLIVLPVVLVRLKSANIPTNSRPVDVTSPSKVMLMTSPSTTANPTTAIDKPEETIYILRNKPTKEELLQLVDMDRLPITTWSEKLFFVQDDRATRLQNILYFDFKTQEVIKIYETSSLDQIVTSIDVIDNKLFIFIGGYMAEGEQYVVDNPDDVSLKLLARISNGKISKWKDRFWIIGGEGDSCWSKTDYAIIDINTYVVKNIATSTSGCYGGEEYVDIDIRNEMILAFHTGESYYDKSNKDSGVYKYVISIPLSQPNIKNGVISRESMPPNVTSVYYSSDKNALLLSGSAISIFWHEGNRIEEVMSLPEKWYRAEIGDWIDESVCMWRMNDAHEEEIAEFNIDTKLQQQNPTRCVTGYSQKYFGNMQYAHEDIPTKLANLSIPDIYEIVKK